MKPPKNGCVILEALRHYGFTPPTQTHANAEIESVVGQAVAQVTPRNVMAFHVPECPAKEGELMKYLPMRPPYDALWIETMHINGSPIGYAVRTEPSRKDPDELLVSITAFRHKPESKAVIPTAYVIYPIDKTGKRKTDEAHAPFYGPVKDDRNATVQNCIVYAAVRILQMMSVGNVGFYEERDPDENNPRLTRPHRRALIGRRYHVLVLRSKADVRAGRKVVDYKGVMPLHMQRGHPKHYGRAEIHGHPDGRDRGLGFGWFEGVWWSQPVAKGEAKNGIVDKDYRIVSGKTAAKSITPIDISAKLQPAPDSFDEATSPLNVDRPAPQPTEAERWN